MCSLLSTKKRLHEKGKFFAKLPPAYGDCPAAISVGEGTGNGPCKIKKGMIKG
jgi:hypothetical protein